jgi:hypothetical protein
MLPLAAETIAGVAARATATAEKRILVTYEDVVRYWRMVRVGADAV